MYTHTENICIHTMHIVLCKRERESGFVNCIVTSSTVPFKKKKKKKKIVPPRVNLFSGSSILANIADFIFNVT